MVSNISQIVYQLFQKETLDEVSESELRYFIRQYPYAGTGHLLLAKKLQLEGEKRAFEREIAVTSIYFNNPAWLQFVLQEPNENGRADTQHPPISIHPTEIEKQIDPEDELEEENTAVEDQEVQPADDPIVVLPGEVSDPASEN
ncbi:hypothetical protein, partial [Flavitalea sp.]|nr:hypothetical protein [Flavitalea sp.]